MTSPITNLITAIPTFTSGLASFRRVQAHLNASSRREFETHCGVPNRKPEIVSPEVAFASFDGDVLSTPLSSTRTNKTTFSDYDSLDFAASVKGTFSWKVDDEVPAIDITGINIERGQFVTVMGPVGCGKSTLLKSLLGELSAFDGTIRRGFNSVAYCDQNPWLPNETIRNIVVAEGDWDEAWYQRCINACCLDKDIQLWPNGDRTVAGSSGITISGGQKQRLAIARALYSRKTFYIFDDVFSALDSTTDNTIFNNLFGTAGMLRRGDFTTVLASSSDRRALWADHVVLLDDKGHIARQGAPLELQSLLGCISTMRVEDQQDTVLS